jgi:NAD(P)-dependent dehydrogenase (short-subunit alcohol dehydrogenase family)
METLDAGLTGKSALVTGAARGIGRGIAETLVDRGADIALNDVDGGSLAGTVETLDAATDRTVVGIEADVSDPGDADRMVGEASTELGGLDVLVNNAAIIDPGGYTDITPAEWGRVLGVNLDGVHYCCAAAVGRMCEGGAIVNISSIAGQGVSVLGGAHYTTAKWGVIGLTKHVAREFGREGIRANAVCPGPTDSDRIRDLTDADSREAVAEDVPLGRWGRPADVGAAVAFLASDAAGFVTGTTLTVDGGFTIE